MHLNMLKAFRHEVYDCYDRAKDALSIQWMHCSQKIEYNRSPNCRCRRILSDSGPACTKPLKTVY